MKIHRKKEKQGNREIQCSLNVNDKTKGITLIALVVTIVVLLILAAVTIVVLFGDKGIFRTAQNATTKFGVEAEREKIENAKIDWYTKKLTGKNVTVENFFEMLQPQIIGDRGDVTGPDDNNTYVVETNAGYNVEIIVDENGNIQIGDIEKGTLAPKIRDIKITTTENSITAKAFVSRTDNKTITYEYKLESEADSSYQSMTVTSDGTATAVGLTQNARYTIKVTIIPTEPLVEKTKTAIARDCRITAITLDKTEQTIDEGKTIQLTANIDPDYAEDKTITWTSSNEEIAEVSSSGLVTAKTVGSATITATANGATNKTATCTITVLEAESNWEYLARVAKSIATRTDINIDSNTENVKGTTQLGESYDISVGDMFKVRYNGEDHPEIKSVRVLGFKHDNLADKTVYRDNEQDTRMWEKAGITFDFVNVLIYDKKTLNTINTNENGWAATEMRKFLNGYNSNTTDNTKIGVLGGEATKLSNSGVIKKVKKEYIATYNTKVETLPKAEDYLWMLSCAEVWNDGYTDGTSGYAIQKEGIQYKYYQNIQVTETKTYKFNEENSSLPKILRSNGAQSDWWLRSPHYHYDNSYNVVKTRGDGGRAHANAGLGVAPGFSI